jgi:hypothetical protein
MIQKNIKKLIWIYKKQNFLKTQSNYNPIHPLIMINNLVFIGLAKLIRFWARLNFK